MQQREGVAIQLTVEDSDDDMPLAASLLADGVSAGDLVSVGVEASEAKRIAERLVEHREAKRRKQAGNGQHPQVNSSDDAIAQVASAAARSADEKHDYIPCRG